MIDSRCGDGGRAHQQAGGPGGSPAGGPCGSGRRDRALEGSSRRAGASARAELDQFAQAAVERSAWNAAVERGIGPQARWAGRSQGSQASPAAGREGDEADGGAAEGVPWVWRPRPHAERAGAAHPPGRRHPRDPAGRARGSNARRELQRLRQDDVRGCQGRCPPTCSQFIGYLIGSRMSRRQVRELLGEVFGIPVSLGALSERRGRARRLRSRSQKPRPSCEAGQARGREHLAIDGKYAALWTITTRFVAAFFVARDATRHRGPDWHALRPMRGPSSASGPCRRGRSAGRT
jgi:hypothetical protein